MKKICSLLALSVALMATCKDYKKELIVDFNDTRVGELPFGWIVSSTNKPFPAIWEVNENKELFIRYPRGEKESQKNIFFTKDYYFVDGEIGAKIVKNGGGVIFRARDRKHYYAVAIDTKAKKLLAEEINGKKIARLKELSLTNMKLPLYLKVKFCGKDADIYINGKKIAKLDNLKRREGGVGVIASGDTPALFDDISIKIAR